MQIPGAKPPTEQGELSTIASELRGLKPGSPEQLEVLERFEPILGAVMAWRGS